MKSITSFIIPLLLLSACASKGPTHLSLNPSPAGVSEQTQAVIPIMVETIDVRKTPTVALFHKEGEQSRAVSLGEPIAKQLNLIFRQGLTQAGYQVDPAASHSVQFQVAHVLIEVTDTTFGYDTKSRVTITLLAKNALQTLTKVYNVRGTNEGAFSPDFATLELELNKLINELTAQILNDAELYKFLQK
jgi:uncharacterized lipoprotein